MFRGFRWQLPAFILATIVFFLALSFRIVRQSSVPDATPFPTSAAQVSTSTAEPAVTQSVRENATLQAVAKPFRGYREGLIGTIQRLNPIFAHHNAVDRDITSLVFQGLFATNDYGAAIPLLAERLVRSSDGLEYVVELRQDIKWQDGIVFTADDVIYTMSLLADPDYAAFSTTAHFWQTVETQKLGDYLVRFRLAQPLASFTNLLTVGILPEHALRGTTIRQLAQHPFNLSPIGTGPYQLEALHVAEDGNIRSVQLQMSPLFPATLDSPVSGQLGNLRFDLFSNSDEGLDAYRSGRIDALANVGAREQLLSLPNARVHTQIQSSLKILILNWEEQLFRDRRIRQALALRLDLPDLVERYFAASVTVADSPLAPGLAAHLSNTFWFTQDIERAKMLFAGASAALSDARDDVSEDGLTPSAESTDTFTILVEDIAPLPSLAADIAAAWGTLGLQVDVDAIPIDDLHLKLQAGDFEAAIVTQHIGNDIDLYRFWHPAQSEAGQNYGSVNSDAISELLEGIRQEGNGIIRQRLLQNFQQQFAEQAIAIPLYYPLYTMAIRDTIDGVRIGYLGTESDRFRSITKWRLLTLPG